LSDKIALVDGKSVWTAKCYGCFACINVRPQQAIQIRASFSLTSRTTETSRYHHLAITYPEVAEQH
jgi:Fe-S-cluster-containing hydrogenase component 2